MNVTSRLKVKGVQYFSGTELIELRVLRKGSSCTLRREPGNQFDAHAVAVMCDDSIKIGYVSKDKSERYSNIIDGQGPLSAEVEDIHKENHGYVIYINVHYRNDSDDHVYTIGGFHELHSQSGVYAIVRKSDGQQYIGSSSDIRDRVIQHLRMLRNKAHHSHKLQKAFTEIGESGFTVKILELACDDLESREAYWIQSTNSCVNGFNATYDGQGHQGVGNQNARGKPHAGAPLTPVWAVGSSMNTGGQNKNTGCAILVIFAIFVSVVYQVAQTGRS
jgi:hypothetical protein